MPIILATWETEIRRREIQGQSISTNKSWKWWHFIPVAQDGSWSRSSWAENKILFKKITKAKRAQNMTHVVECLLS
jgi:hypothetical protein